METVAYEPSQRRLPVRSTNKPRVSATQPSLRKALRKAGLYKALPEASTARSDVKTHRQAHGLARIKPAHAQLRPLTFRRVESGIGVGHRLGDEDATRLRGIELEEMRLGRREAKLEGPIRIAHPGFPAPAAEAIVEPLPAHEAIGEVVPPFRRNLVDRQDLFIDCPGAGDPSVEPSFGTAREIGVLAEPARHRISRAVFALE